MVMVVMLLALAHSVQTTRPRIHKPPVSGNADTINPHRHWRQNVVEVFKVLMGNGLSSQVNCGEEPAGAASARWSAAYESRKITVFICLESHSLVVVSALSVM